MTMAVGIKSILSSLAAIQPDYRTARTVATYLAQLHEKANGTASQLVEDQLANKKQNLAIKQQQVESATQGKVDVKV